MENFVSVFEQLFGLNIINYKFNVILQVMETCFQLFFYNGNQMAMSHRY